MANWVIGVAEENLEKVITCDVVIESIKGEGDDHISIMLNYSA